MANVLQQLKTDFRIKLGYGAAFVLLLLSYILTWYANQELASQSRWVIHSNTLINHIESLGSYMKDAETGVRGYIIGNDKDYLTPYIKSRPRVDSMFDLLKDETQDNTSEQIILYTIKSLINRKYEVLDSTVKRYQDHRFVLTDSSLMSQHRGKEIMDSIRMEMDILKVGEQQVFISRGENLHNKYAAMDIIIVSSLLLAFLFACLGFITYLRENKARKMADEKVEEYQRQLQRRIGELDVANKELIEMRSREQFAATGRFARTIAHEVRNPLTNIDLAASQLKTELPQTDENQLMLFDIIERNSKRINQLITELLNATRFTELKYEKVSVNDLLNETLELAKDRFTLNHIRIEKHYTPGMPMILVDKEKIKIAFLNIIVNAVEVMEDGNGILKVITKAEDGKCVVEIQDNGIGMDTATKNKLFEPYYTSKPKGNGLGLTNTQNIIFNHRATIAVESEPGKGAAFIIKFDFAS
jgi:two-component system, NtrC family, sensor histidine kinase HydH